MSFADLSLGLNGGIFAAAALGVWIAGTKLAHYVDAIAEETGLAREFLGIVLLGAVTSMPEFAIATTATLQGTPGLSVNNVLGAASINLVVLAIADAVSGRDALTSVPASPVLMVQGVLGMLLLAIAGAPIITGDIVIVGIGAWSWVMLVTYVLAVRLLARSNAAKAWQVKQHIENKQLAAANGEQKDTLRTLIVRTVAAGAVILGAGFLLARTGETLAEQTGLGTSFFGAVFLALATSLPESSTAIGASRMGRYELAISNVFGTNLFNVMIIVFVDALHDGGPVMVEVGKFAAFGATLALLLTSFMILGMLERRNRAVLRMGMDSIAVIAAYAAGVVVLHGLR